MNFILRMPFALWCTIRQDQIRRHEHAFERVGFLLARVAALQQTGFLVLPYEYLPVADDDYLQDSSVGARINSSAIRAALQRAMTDQASLFHVHPHPHSGKPVFSSTDQKTNAALVPSFFNASPRGLHGALVLSADSISGAVWETKESNPVQLKKITIVGSPQFTFGDEYASPTLI